MLAGELDADGADGLHHDGLELVRDLGHEAADLLHESLHARLTARLGEDRSRGTVVSLGMLYKHTFRRVVMARVAMLRLVSDMRFSRSTLHVVTASG